MFSITIAFGSSGASLLFKTEETFAAAKDKYRSSKATSFEGDELHLIDDFGMEISIRRASIHGATFEDMDHTKLAHVERGLHQFRTQIAADKAGMTAPDISAYLRGRGAGPAVISPNFGSNGAFRQ